MCAVGPPISSMRSRSSRAPAGSRFVDPRVVDRAVLPALGAGAVVRHEHDERVVELADLGQEVEQPPDLGVGVGQEGREALHEPRRHHLIGGVELVPGGHPRRSGRQLGAGRHDARLELPSEGLVAPPVPSPVERPVVALDPLGGGVMGGMAGPGAEVEEEPPIRVDGAQVAQEADGLVGQVGAEVVALGHRPGRGHRVVVVVERGDELVGLATMEAVPTVEAASEGPAAARCGHVRLVVGGEVPLADRVGRVPLRLQDLGQEAVLVGDLARVAGIPHGQVGDAPHPVGVVVAPREQAGTSR